MPETNEAGRYLCYEGFPLESVLARVTADHGAAATITSAERVRRGGVRGFFARELFQVIVDLGDAAMTQGAANGAQVLGRLTASGVEFDADDTRLASNVADFDGRLADSYGAELFGDESYGADEIDPEDVEGALALTVRSAPLPAEMDAPMWATESPSGWDDDAELWGLLASSALAAAAENDRVDAAAETPDIVLPDLSLPEPSIAAVAAPSLAAPSLAALLAAAPPAPLWDVDDALATLAPSTVPFVTETVSEAAIAGELVNPIRSLGPIASTTVIPATGGVDGTPFDPFRRPAITTAVPQSDEVVAHAIAAFRSAEGVLDRDETAVRVDLDSLISSFELSLDHAPALPAHGVVVLVGDRDDALAAATSWSQRLGLGADAVVVASPSNGGAVPAQSELDSLALAARSRVSPLCLVVVELVAGRDGHEWTRAVADGFRADQQRFVADAERYLSHQHFSVAAIGGADAVDLLGVAELGDPTAPLGVGVPIGSIDGRPASPELWAATVLASRIRSQRGVMSDGAEGN